MSINIFFNRHFGFYLGTHFSAWIVFFSTNLLGELVGVLWYRYSIKLYGKKESRQVKFLYILVKSTVLRIADRVEVRTFARYRSEVPPINIDLEGFPLSFQLS